MTTIHTDGGDFEVTESVEQARNRVRKAINKVDQTVLFHLANGTEIHIISTHIVAIEG